MAYELKIQDWYHFFMDDEKKHEFSGPVTTFHERRLPETATPAGYAALIDALRLRVPVPRILSAIGPHHKQYERDGWRIYTPRHAPKPDLEGHLTFALKNEGVDLGVLKALFRATGPAPIEAMVRATPTGSYARRAWFLYEWLLGTKLDLPDADKGSYALGRRSGPAMGGSRHDVLAPPRQKQPAGNARLLSHDHMDGHAAALDRARPAGARARSRRQCAGRPARAHGGLPAAQGFQIQLRH